MQALAAFEGVQVEGGGGRHTAQVNGCSVLVSVPAFDHGAEGGRRREMGRAFDDGPGEELVPPIGSAFVDGAVCVGFGLGNRLR